MHSLSRIALVGLLGSGLAFQVAAQATTTAVCITDQWTFNQENVSPCLVAAALQGACNGGKFLIPAVTPGRLYTGPLLGFSNVCTCSTVTYSMVAACGACQDASIDTWTDWKTNCTQADISISSFPLGIPPGTTVPSWAFLNVTAGNVWDATAANAAHNAGSPDSTPSVPSATATAGGSGAPGSLSASGGSKTPVAAIAGGVVGGVVGLLLIGGLVFFLVRRNKRGKSSAPSAQYAQSGLPSSEKFGAPSGYPSSSAPMAAPYYVDTNQANAPPFGPPDMTGGPKLYDPADPSTFPSTQRPVSASPGYSTPPPSNAPYGSVSSMYGGSQVPIPAPNASYGSGSYLPEPASPTQSFNPQTYGSQPGYHPMPATAHPQQFGMQQGPPGGGTPGQGYGTPEV